MFNLYSNLKQAVELLQNIKYEHTGDFSFDLIDDEFYEDQTMTTNCSPEKILKDYPNAKSIKPVYEISGYPDKDV